MRVTVPAFSAWRAPVFSSIEIPLIEEKSSSYRYYEQLMFSGRVNPPKNKLFRKRRMPIEMVPKREQWNIITEKWMCLIFLVVTITRAVKITQIIVIPTPSKNV